jgi:hypothetical protein
VPGVIKYLFFHHVGSDTNVSSHLYMQTGVAPTPAQAQAAADAAHNAYVTSCLSLLEASYTLTQVKVTDLSSASGPIGVNTTSAAGTRTGLSNAASVCVLMNIPVARRYRGGKPRVYWPWGVNADLVTPQTWSTAFLTACATAWNAFGNALVSSLSSWAPTAGICTVSYIAGHDWKSDQNGNYHRVPIYRSPPLVDRLAANALFPPTPGSQRARLRPGG